MVGGVAKGPAAELKKFFRHRPGRQGELTEWRMQGIRQAMPAIRDRAVIEAKPTVVQVIAPLGRTLLQGIAMLDRKIAEAAEAHPDFSFSSRCREQGQHWRRACWPLWARNEIAMGVRTRYRNTAGWHR